MKLGLPFLVLWALAARSICSSGEFTTLTGKKVAPEKELVCQLDVLRSYLLKGRREPSETDPLVVCPGVKSNCCTKADQQRIYHVVNDILPPRILNYEERIKSALAAIRKFHAHVVDNPPKFLGSPARVGFCQRQARSLYAFPIGTLLSTLFDLLLQVNHEMRDYYRRFYCVLCDSRNHPAIVLGSKAHKVMFDARFCQATLKSKEDLISTLNVQLVAYLVTLQNVVDCKHYVRSYNLPFFSQEAIKDTVGLVSCLDFLQGKDFMKYCRSTCAKLHISRIATVLQGDLDFLTDTLNLFKKFFEFRESGNFVSAKVRKFFKEQTEADRSNKAPRQLGRKSSEGREEPGLLDRFRKISEEQFKKAGAVYRAEEKKEANHSAIKKASRKLAKARRLKDGGDAPKSTHLVKTVLPRTDNGLDSGRILSSPPQPAQPQKAAAGPHAQAPSSPHHSKPEEEKKGRGKAMVFSNPKFKETYSLIHIERKAQVKSYVYPVQSQPIDFDSCVKVFQSRGGINPDLYDRLNFDLTPRQFYLQLYGDNRVELPSIPLQFMLADFSNEAMEVVHKELAESFRIDPDNWDSVESKVPAFGRR